jgi:hypothetical protein
MQLSIMQRASGAMVGAVIIVLDAGIPAIASSFSPEPLFDTVASFSTTIPTAMGADAADVYFPVISALSAADKLPIALLLQGSLVDKAEYANFASIVASYGFGVVVPNHERTLFDPGTGQAITGFFPEQQQVKATLTHLTAQNANPLSPVFGLLDPNKLVLLGHSFGGAVGLASLSGECVPILCIGQFERPDELVGGAFYGAPFFDPRVSQGIPPIDNDGLPVGMVAGSLDGVAPLPLVQATYANIQDPPKALITVLGANHYGITNTDNLVRERSRPTLDQAVATETIARWSALFLRATALGDRGAFDYVFETGDALDENVSAIGETKSVPEPSLLVGLLAFGAIALLYLAP